MDDSNQWKLTDMQESISLEPKMELALPDWSSHALVGRDEDISAIRSMLLQDNIQLITITGTAGVGKTRIAMEVMKELRLHYPVSVLLDMTQISDTSDFLPLLARSIGVVEGITGNIFQKLIQAIGSRHMLLILNTCEHLIGNLLDLCLLIEVCPNLKVIATSRNILRMKCEHIYRLSPLALPDHDQLENADELLSLSSVVLFIRKILVKEPNYTFTAKKIKCIGSLCIRLDGIPLAIEIAAARFGQAGSLLEFLDTQLDCIHEDSVDARQHQHTLRDSIEWSYSLLTDSEQRLFRRLSVFPESWSLQQAVGICSGNGINGKDVHDILNNLVACSLVTEKADPSGNHRYCFLSNIRACAYRHLAETNMEHVMKKHHRDWFLALAEQTEPDSWNSQIPAWLGQIRNDSMNYRAAMEFCGGSKDEASAGLRMWAAISRYFDIRGYYSYEFSFAKELLKLCETPCPTRARVLQKLSQLALKQERYEEAAACAEECLCIASGLDDVLDGVGALCVLGFIENLKERFVHADHIFKQAVKLAQSSMENDPRSLYISLFWQGLFYCMNAKYENAIDAFQQGLDLTRKQEDPCYMAVILAGLGRALLGKDDILSAEKALTESISFCCQLNYVELTSFCLDIMGQVSWRKNNRKQTVNLFGLAMATRTRVGILSWLPDQEYVMIMKSIGNEVNQTAAALLNAPSPENIITMAIAALKFDNPSICNDDSSKALSLSQRELEVAAYIAQGLTNREIADRVFLSKRTIDAHVRNILQKLELENRAQISSWYAENHWRKI